MRTISLLLTIAFASVFLQPASAQFGQPSKNNDQQDFKMQKRLFIGGGLGFGISSYSTSLMIAPEIGYRLSPSFDVGSRLIYTYYRYNDDLLKYSTNNYGLAFYTRYYLFFFQDLFLHAEYEALNYERVYLDYNYQVDHKERIWVSSLFVGGGYRQWIGNTAFIGITVLWNLLDDIDSPYSNPIFRIGVGVGL
ncbi:MAG: hypothetical protein V2I47_12725 [Bacteroidales bacterium]|nr:hypothetical protein [Bacteroidales bacterium]